MRAVLIYALLFTMCVSGKSWAMFMDLSDPVPVDRLIKMISAYIEENPDDAHGYYLLGRVHSLAFAKKSVLKMVFYEDQEKTKNLELPRFTPWSTTLDSKNPLNVLEEYQKEHLVKSIQNYFMAVTKNPNSSLYALGLGWMLEQALPYTRDLGPPPYRISYKDSMHEDQSFQHLLQDISIGRNVIENERLLKYYKHAYCNDFADAWKNGSDRAKERLLRYMLDIWKEECLWAYRQSYGNGIYQQVKTKSTFDGIPDFQPEMEAGRGIIRIIGDRKNELTYQWEVEAIQKSLEVAQSAGGMITPIIFSMHHSNSIHELLAPKTHVRFNMDGMSDESQWSWVKPDTAILVWDPERRGDVKSGKQLFGSVTWWLFWENGYQAMAMLDDDRNGYLEENELNGLAVWQDSNQNGVSEDGEVVPIENTEIVRMAVQPEVNVGKTIHHKKGIQLKNGSWLPSYDWFPDRIAYPTE